MSQCFVLKCGSRLSAESFLADLVDRDLKSFRLKNFLSFTFSSAY
jgi:hypothetical protein